MNLPNQLTLARCLLVPVFVALMSFDNFTCYTIAYAVFSAAAITDYFDGKIAREQNLVTNFGKLLDPIADKVLMASGFIMMISLDSLAVPAWTVIAIIGREFLVTGARALAASEGQIIAANNMGKLKTVVQMVYVFTFLFFATVEQLADMFPENVAAIYRAWVLHGSMWGIIAVSLFTVYSGIQFAKQNWAILGIGKV